MRSSSVIQVLALLGLVLGCLYLAFMSPIAVFLTLYTPTAVYSSFQFLSKQDLFRPSPMALSVATVVLSLSAFGLTFRTTRLRLRRPLQAFLLALILAPAALLGAEYMLPLPASTVLLLALTFPGDPTFFIHLALALTSIVLVSIPIYLVLSLAATLWTRRPRSEPPAI